MTPRQTQCERLLEALKHGERVTPLESWYNLGIPQPARRIYDLKKQGWGIEKKTVNVKNKYGEDCAVACYFLVDKTPAYHKPALVNNDSIMKERHRSGGGEAVPCGGVVLREVRNER